MTKTRNFFKYLVILFSQEFPWNIAYRPNMIKDRGQTLRKTRSAIRRMKVQAKSELNISILLLPERHKPTPYYQTPSSEMDEKQKALAMRWKFERIRKDPDKLNPVTKRTTANFKRSFWSLHLYNTIRHYYGRLSKREIYTCLEILYSIWDSGDGYYDNIV